MKVRYVTVKLEINIDDDKVADDAAEGLRQIIVESVQQNCGVDLTNIISIQTQQ